MEQTIAGYERLRGRILGLALLIAMNRAQALDAQIRTGNGKPFVQTANRFSSSARLIRLASSEVFSVI